MYLFRKQCLLSSFLGGFSISSSLFSNTLISLVGSSESKSVEYSIVSHFVSDGLSSRSGRDGWESEDTLGGVLDSTGELFGSRVVDFTLSWSISSSWEEDNLVLVLGESLNISLHGISVSVTSSVVNSNTDSLSESSGETGSSQFVKGETSTELDLGTVSSGLTENDWSKLADWSDTGIGSSLSSSLGSELLVGWGIEEASNSSHPMLSQVSTLKDIIVFYHVAY